MADGTDRDLYQRFELEVRTPGRRLLIDAFLPPPDAIPSAVAPAPPPASPIFQTDELGILARLDEEEEPAPKPKPRKRAAPVRKKKEADADERPLSLQEEIAEFMNRGKTALAPDDDMAPPPRSEAAAPAPPSAPADPKQSAAPDGPGDPKDPSDPGSDPGTGG